MNFSGKLLAAAIVTGVAVMTSTVWAQETNVPVLQPPTVTTTANVAPQLPYGVPEILQLAKAKVSDSTIVAFINNSGNSYNLNAGQIIYLKQQGVSDAVISAMLNQPKATVTTTTTASTTSVPTPSTPAPPVTSTATTDTSTATVAPTVTYVQTVPTTTYYYSDPYPYYSGYYYPYYPTVVIGGSWGWGWHGGYHGWHGSGGWHGGYHGGGGFHGHH